MGIFSFTKVVSAKWKSRNRASKTMLMKTLIVMTNISLNFLSGGISHQQKEWLVEEFGNLIFIQHGKKTHIVDDAYLFVTTT